MSFDMNTFFHLMSLGGDNNYSFECKYKYLLNNIWLMKSILFILPLEC